MENSKAEGKKSPDGIVMRIFTLAASMHARLSEDAFEKHRDALNDIREDMEDILVEIYETEAAVDAAIRANDPALRPKALSNDEVNQTTFNWIMQFRKMPPVLPSGDVDVQQMLTDLRRERV